MKCNKDVSEIEKEKCKEDHYDDLDLENLGGNARIKKRQKTIPGKHQLPSKSTLTAIADEFLESIWFRTLIEAKEMWYWDHVGKVWIDEGKSYLVTWLGEKYPDLKRSDYLEIEFHIQKQTVIRPKQFESNPFFLNFMGKELNLKTMKDEGDVDHEHFCKTKLSTELDLKAPPPFEFLKSLQNAIPNGPDLYHCLQAFSSILLIKTMRIEKAFFFLGSGGNGKSTVMKAVENIFENYISHVDLGDLVHDRFSSASLVNKLANIYADIQTLKFKDMAIFKAISSGDTISVADKYEKRHDQTIKVIQFYSANKMPTVDDKNPGFLRRASPILFDMKIQNPDPYIDDKLATPEERKKILALLVRIARTTKAKGFLFEKNEQEIQQILESKEDPIIQFINDPEWIKRGAEYEIERGQLYDIYMKYCKLMNCTPKQTTAFSRYISERGFQTRRTNTNRFWIGLGVDHPKKAEGISEFIEDKLDS